VRRVRFISLFSCALVRANSPHFHSLTELESGAVFGYQDNPDLARLVKSPPIAVAGSVVAYKAK
jgi:hypothetical protein